jgi:hypothetical protein
MRGIIRDGQRAEVAGEVRHFAALRGDTDV